MRKKPGAASAPYRSMKYCKSGYYGVGVNITTCLKMAINRGNISEKATAKNDDLATAYEINTKLEDRITN